jgi:DNA-binding NarL/FixJ family response regulator
VNCVLLGERHSGLGEGIRGLLETTFNAVFTVADVTSLTEGAARIQPVMAVVDLSLAEGDLPSLIRTLRARAPLTKILLLSVHDEADVSLGAVDAGADGLVVKRAIATDLLEAVDALLAGRRYISPGAGDRPAANVSRPT